VKVVGHYYELVKKEALFLAIVEEAVHEQRRHAFGLKDGAMRIGRRCHEESADGLGWKVH